MDFRITDTGMEKRNLQYMCTHSVCQWERKRYGLVVWFVKKCAEIKHRSSCQPLMYFRSSLRMFCAVNKNPKWFKIGHKSFRTFVCMRIIGRHWTVNTKWRKQPLKSRFSGAIPWNPFENICLYNLYHSDNETYKLPLSQDKNPNHSVYLYALKKSCFSVFFSITFIYFLALVLFSHHFWFCWKEDLFLVRSDRMKFDPCRQML